MSTLLAGRARSRAGHNARGHLVEQGNLPAALDAFKASQAIRDRLAKADPGNAGWQRDLALSFGRVAMVEAQQGARDRATGLFRQGRDIIAGLKARSPDNATLPRGSRVVRRPDRGAEQVTMLPLTLSLLSQKERVIGLGA